MNYPKEIKTKTIKKAKQIGSWFFFINFARPKKKILF